MTCARQQRSSAGQYRKYRKYRQGGKPQVARGRTGRKRQHRWRGDAQAGRKKQAARRRTGKKKQRTIKPIRKGATGPTQKGAKRPTRQASLHRKARQYQFQNGRINSLIGSHRTGAGVPPSGADRSHRCFAGTAQAGRQIGSTRSPGERSGRLRRDSTPALIIALFYFADPSLRTAAVFRECPASRILFDLYLRHPDEP
jgi:hypothetical protein